MQLTLTHGGQTYTNFTAEDLATAGVPAGVIGQGLTDALVLEATRRIDAVLDRIFTTSASRAQRYDQKYAEAKAYRDAGYPGNVAEGDYPFLVAEAAVRGSTKREQADLVIATAEGFQTIGALAEACRAELPVRLDGPDGEPAKRAEMTAALNEFQTALSALTQEA